MDPIRHGYEQHGVDGFYRLHGSSYRNPHEPDLAPLILEAVRTWVPDLGNVLDLAAGSGEATLVLQALGATVQGADPWTGAAYRARTGQEAEVLSFEDVAAGALEGRSYSLVVCSYALHLCEPSRLPAVAYGLARVAPNLLTLSPHKRPVISPAWGWEFVGEMMRARIRVRYYRSLATPGVTPGPCPNSP